MPLVQAEHENLLLGENALCCEREMRGDTRLNSTDGLFAVNRKNR